MLYNQLICDVRRQKVHSKASAVDTSTKPTMPYTCYDNTYDICKTTLRCMYQTALFMSSIWGGSAPPYSYLGGLKHPLAPPPPFRRPCLRPSSFIFYTYKLKTSSLCNCTPVPADRILIYIGWVCPQTLL